VKDEHILNLKNPEKSTNKDERVERYDKGRAIS
jgi:hypothetical protein